jgi:hypothetical protein
MSEMPLLLGLQILPGPIIHQCLRPNFRPKAVKIINAHLRFALGSWILDGLQLVLSLSVLSAK